MCCDGADKQDYTVMDSDQCDPPPPPAGYEGPPRRGSPCRHASPQRGFGTGTHSARGTMVVQEAPRGTARLVSECAVLMTVARAVSIACS